MFNEKGFVVNHVDWARSIIINIHFRDFQGIRSTEMELILSMNFHVDETLTLLCIELPE